MKMPYSRRRVASAALAVIVAALAAACSELLGPAPKAPHVVFLNGSTRDTLLVANPETGAIEQRIPFPFRVHHFAFSPAGDRLAVLGDRRLWVMNTDGSDARPIHPDGGTFAWSPDGKQIAYITATREIRIVNVDGTGDRVVPNATPGGRGGISWSPDGRRIAFGGTRTSGTGWTSTVYDVGIDGTGLRDVDLTLPGHDVRASGEPTWSHDGRSLAITRWFLLSDFEVEQKLWVVTPATGTARRITSGDGSDVRPTWSPDRGYIAFLRFEAGSDRGDVYIVRSDGRGLRRVTSTPEGEEYPQFWVRE